MSLDIQFFLLLSFMLVSVPLCSSSYISTTALKNDAGAIGYYGTLASSFKNITCSNVPYPFGSSGKALPGFEIECPEGNSGSPFLPISKTTYIIREISFEGYIKIYAGPIQRRCSGANGKWNDPEISGEFNLEGTPFTLSSQSNVLTVVGCNNLVQIRNGQDTNLTSGCVTFCDTGSLSSRSCSGLGCCQATLPGALQSFDLQFEQVSVFNSTGNLLNCSTAFFSPRDDFLSNGSMFLFQNNAEAYDTYAGGDNLIQLDWAIGNESCEVASKKTGSFACKSNSYCYDSQSMPGYLCSCSQGYQGNPYAEDGCTDIDECLEQDSNLCVGYCINLPGNYSCSCPQGMTGDGRQDGTGCKMVSLHDAALNSKLIILVGIGSGIGLLFIVQSLHIFIKRTTKRRKRIIRERLFKQNHGLLLQQFISSNRDVSERLKIFTLEELKQATNKFDQTRIIGQGGHGIVYKGILLDQRVVAIKRSQIVVQREINEFINEVVILSQIDHRNVVKLYGCCLESEVPLLVYEFISNGTLFDHLHVEGYHFLSWEDRFWIMLEIARALAHLHSTASISVFHRDIKSSNVLLDDYLTAKVSDFGASRSIQVDETGITTAVQGTFGYLDPEYYHTGRLTGKSDVYSFGVILAELLTRQKSVSSSRFQEGENLASYFCTAVRENKLTEILDPEIIEEENLAKVAAVTIIAEVCLKLKGEERPTMKEVESRLEILRGSKKRQVHPTETTNRSDIRDETSRIYSLEKEFLLSSSFPR